MCRALHEDHSRCAACRALYTCLHGDIFFPNSINPSVRLHFSCPCSGNVPGTDRFNSGSPETLNIPSNDARFGGSQNMDRISHTESRGASTVSKIILSRSEGSPLPSITLPTTPVWVSQCPIFSRALIHAMSFALHSRSDTHSGTITLGTWVSPRNPGASIPPKLGRCSFAPCNRSTSHSLTGLTSSRSASREHISSPLGPAGG